MFVKFGYSCHLRLRRRHLSQALVRKVINLIVIAFEIVFKYPGDSVERLNFNLRCLRGGQ